MATNAQPQPAPAGTADTVTRDRPTGRSRAERQEMFWGILCVLPAVLGFVLFSAGPMIGSLGLSFTQWNVAGTPHLIGLDNYREMFTEDRLFPQALKVTLTYAIISVPLRIIVAFALAMLLNQKLRALPLFRAIFYLPSIVPLIASSVVWLWMFNPDFGLINGFLRPLGFPKQQWIYASDTALPSLIVMSLLDIGPMMIIFLAGLQGVPASLYDAVSVDGGGAWRRFWNVTVPMSTPTILFNLILAVIASFQTFTQAFVMTDGGPNNATLFYGFYLYRKAFEEGEMGYASALGWILFLIIAALSILIFRTSNRWTYYEGGN